MSGGIARGAAFCSSEENFCFTPAHFPVAKMENKWYYVLRNQNTEVNPMQNMNFKRKLPVPKEIKEQYPLTAALA